jgi:hypothetical protein
VAFFYWAYLFSGRPSFMLPPQRPEMAAAARWFVPIWLIGAAINMWVGVAKAGYSVAEEAPIFLVVFAVPAAVAILVAWSLSRA